MDDGASVVVATSEGLVIGLSATNGSALWSWKAPTGGRVFSSPKELGERIYFGSYDSSFYCLFASNGSLSWSYPGCSGYIHTTPAIAQVDGSPVVLFGACDGTMNCLDATSGEVLWTFTTAYIPSSPSVSGERVYFGSYDDKLFCLDLEDGTEVWNRSLPDGVYSSPAVLGEKVTVGCNDGNLYMLDALTGEVIWNRTMTEGALESSPLLFRDRVVVTTSDGMFLLDTEDGAVTRGFELGNAGDISPTYVGGSVLFGDSAGWVRAVSFEEVNGTDDDDDDGRERIPIWPLLVLAMIAIPIILIIIYRMRLDRGNHRER
jgi:outer membrane protein assembly factor BamB